MENCVKVTKGLEAGLWNPSKSIKYYVAPIVYEQYKTFYTDTNPRIANNLCKANVLFWYNFEGSENLGIYRINHANEGDIITSPGLSPQREDFHFSGWYLDAECTQSYNFGEVMSNEMEVYNFYAKWEE